MAIEITCIGCGKVLHVPDAASGKKGKCPHCRAILQIPAAAEQPFTEAALEFQPPMQPPPPSTNARDGTKACPYCSEQIKSAAIVCRFCGMNLMSGETTRGQTRTPTSQPPVSTAPVPKTIEQTDKKYKGGCCLGSVLVVGGLILLSGGTGAMRYQLGHDADSWVIVGAIFLCLGLATLIGSAFLSRWHHG